MKRTAYLLLISIIILCSATSCKEYRPEVSWSDYNSVEDVHYHFLRNNDEVDAHIGDTLKVYGYIKKCGCQETCNGWHTMTISKELAHSDDPQQCYHNPHVELFIRRDNLLTSPNEYTDTLAYVTGIVNADDQCELHVLFLNVLKIKTNPDEIE